MDFKEYLEANALVVDTEVEKILSQFLTEVKNTNVKLTPFAQGLINSCKGGKRIRGVLVKLGYELANQSQESRVLPAGRQGKSQEILKIAAAFEILHAGFLIHDDIEDKSSTRRGQPSLYQALGGQHYGISQAINLGDISLYLPIRIITESNFSDKVKIKALSHFTQMVINTGWGQVMDVWLTQSEHTSEESKPCLPAGRPTSEEIQFININKTAKYTIAGPLQIGAILAGADDELIKHLGQFGENAGVVFQVQDDILDQEVESLDLARAKALEYALAAKKSIPKITKDHKKAVLLEQMVKFLVEREK